MQACSDAWGNAGCGMEHNGFCGARAACPRLSFFQTHSEACSPGPAKRRSSRSVRFATEVLLAERSLVALFSAAAWLGEGKGWAGRTDYALLRSRLAGFLRLH